MDAIADEFLNLPEGYGSDDDAEALGLVPRPVYKQGEQSCIEIFKHAMANRVASKKRLRNHEHTAKAPTTQIVERRWLNRFQAFSKTLNVP